MKLRYFVIVVVVIILIVLFLLGKRVDVRTNKHVAELDEELQEILYLGSLAPNSHNIQSWKIEIYPGENYLTICLDESRRLKVVDPKDRELYISLGCYVETLIKGFSAYGYETKYEICQDENYVRLEYSKTSGVIDKELISIITKRHTDKRAFDRSVGISEKEYSYIDENNRGIYFFSVGDNKFDLIKSETLEAYTEQAYNKEVAAELSSWLRFSDKEALDQKDGLPAEQLGISGIKKTLYYLSTNHESAQGESFAKQGITTTKNQLDGCTGFVIVNSVDSAKELILCGMKTVDLWLGLTKDSISVQPMSYAIECVEYRETLEKELGIANIQMILRVGYTADYGKNAAIRRDLADYISVK